MPDPLWSRAPGRFLRSGAWAPLVVSAYVLVGAAAAAGPMFEESAGNAAVRSALAVPPSTQAADAPVVRYVAGVEEDAGPSGTPGPRASAAVRALESIPGLGAVTTSAQSVGPELAPRGSLVPVVQAGDRVARARLVGIDEPASVLVPVGGAPAPPTAQGAGVWLSAPTAEALGVGPGDTVQVGSDGVRDRPRTPAVVAGVYAVADDGRRPADAAGTTTWTVRRASLPRDTQFGTLVSALVVTDVGTALRLAEPAGDTLLWSADARLDPAVPTLRDAVRTAEAVRTLDRVTLGEVGASGRSALRPDLVSGLPDLVDDARASAEATVARTGGLSLGGVALGWGAVLAVTLFGLSRRTTELRLSAASARHPLVTAGQGLLEVLAPVAVAGAVGVAVARGVMAVVGPDGAVTAASVEQGTRAAAVAVGVALAVVVAVTALAAAQAGRLHAPGPSRSWPWEALLAAAGLTAAAGALTGGSGSSVPTGLDLLVPVLALAGVGALGARLALGGLRRATSGRRPARRSAHRTPRTARPGARTLALRRLAAGGTERVALVCLLATGWGLLLHAGVAAQSVTDAVASKAAVLAGTAARAEVPGSWALDAAAPSLPPAPGPDEPTPEPPPVRTPDVPAGDTLAWTLRVSIGTQSGFPELLVVDPATFEAAADWGRSAAMRQARGTLDVLARADDAAVAELDDGLFAPVPAIVVGRPALPVGTEFTVEAPFLQQRLTAVAAAEAFPGRRADDAMLVVASGSMFASVGLSDPRYRPDPDAPPAPDSFRTWLWSAQGPRGLDAVLEPAGVVPSQVVAAAQQAARPSLVAGGRGVGYQLALGVCAGLLGVLALALFADRTAVRGRAGDVLLSRTGLGRRRVLAARLAEVAGLALLAAGLAVLGVSLVAPLLPRLVDPDAGLVPALEVRPGLAAPAALAGVVVLGLVVALAVLALRARGTDDAAVLRDAE